MMPRGFYQGRSPFAQRGSALLFALVFMAVLARMALSGLDAALLGTQAALNYRDIDRVFHTAEALLVAVDSSLLERIETDGLQTTLDTLSGTEVEIVLSPESVKQLDTAAVSYQAEALGFSMQPSGEVDASGGSCGSLYRLTLRASGRRAGTQVNLGLERQVCCDDEVACEAGEFVSISRSWRRLD